MLTGDSDDFSKHYLGVISNKEFILIELKYFDRIHVNKENSKALIESCKDVR